MPTLLKWLAIVLVVLVVGGVAAWFGARAYVREPVELAAAGPPGPRDADELPPAAAA